MADYDVIVIGAGNGGLMAAARLAKKDVKVLVLERHNIPGGCATSFCRGRFEFEVALHQLSGIGTEEVPGPLRRMLKSVGAIDQLDFVEMTDLYRVHSIPDQLDITLKPNRQDIVIELQKHFPKEKEGIAGYFDFIYRYFSEALGAFYMQDPDISKEKYPLYFEYALKNADEVMNQYISDPLLKFAVSPYWTYIGIPPTKMTFHDMASMFVGYCEFKPTHMKGGSQTMSNAIANSIIENGSQIRYNCGVKKIVVKEGRAYGVVTDDGEEISAKAVISNASKVSTYVDLIDPEFVPEEVKGDLKQTDIAQGAFCIYMGLDCEPGEVGITESTNFIFGTTDAEKSYQQMRKLEITEEDIMLLTCYDLMDPSFAPKGTSQIVLVTLKYGDSWLQVPPAQYAEKKYECAESMLRTAEKVYPGIRKHIEEVEVATPITCMRYLSHPKGSVYGFDHHIKDSELFLENNSHIKGLHGVGGWTGLCGFQPTLTSGVVMAKTVLNELKAQ